MSPAAMLNEKDYGDVSMPLLEMANAEIEKMRSLQKESPPPQQPQAPIYHSFPPACLTLLQKLDGNNRCVDCGERDPQWAAVSYGALLCLHCSGHHRSLGVTVSLVRSVSMDEWSLEQVVAMLEGGNSQLAGFFSRHALTQDACPDKRISPVKENVGNRKTISKENVTRLRYKTKAALFYRQQMQLHVARVLEAGPYKGRELLRAQRQNHPMERRNSTE